MKGSQTLLIVNVLFTNNITCIWIEIFIFFNVLLELFFVCIKFIVNFFDIEWCKRRCTIILTIIHVLNIFCLTNPKTH